DEPRSRCSTCHLEQAARLAALVRSAHPGSSRGDFATAGSLIAEADMIREATGTRIGRLAAVNLEGIRGRGVEAVGLLGAEARSGSGGGQGQVTQWCKWASAFLYNGLGRYEQALTAAQNASEEAPELLASRWALAELIEAAARTGRTGLTVGALERLAESTSAGGGALGMGRPPHSPPPPPPGHPAPRVS